MTEESKDHLYRKVKILNETTWEFRANRPSIDKWLSNFKDDNEKLHALFLLSQFMYFGSLQMRELLKALYRDLLKYPIIEGIRYRNGDSLDGELINNEYKSSLVKTRFLGVGNPSESGTHLLYFFRQENRLPKDLFINTHEIFRVDDNQLILADPSIERYVFIDDFCGSGSQVKISSNGVVAQIKAANPDAEIVYLMLFATTKGRDKVRKEANFTRVDAVVELDNSFRYFDADSRYLKDLPTYIDKAFLQNLCESHGEALFTSIYTNEGLKEPTLSRRSRRDRLGFRDSQLLIGFHHNTPNNTLPIIWYDEKHVEWVPAFRRYNKIYAL